MDTSGAGAFLSSWSHAIVSQLTGRALKALFWIYVLVCLADPLDQMFHAKTTLFVILMAFWFARLALGWVDNCSNAMWTGVVGVGLVVPLIATFVGLLSGRNPVGMRFSTLEIFVLLFLLLVIETEKIQLEWILIRCCLLLAVVEIAITVVALASPLLYVGIYEFTALKQTAYLSVDTDRLGIGVGSFYYKTSATMILPLAYYCARMAASKRLRIADVFFFLVYLSAMLFTGARANLLAALAVCGVFALVKIYRTLGVVWSFSTFLVLFSVLITAYAPRFFNPAEASNAVKLGHVASYITEFERHPSYLLWGEGADTEFYSEGFQENTTITEVTYLELIRNFGIPVSILLAILLCWPVVALASRESRRIGTGYFAVPYAAYLLMAATNPLLLSTTGLLIVVAAWGLVLSIRDRAAYIDGGGRCKGLVPFELIQRNSA